MKNQTTTEEKLDEIIGHEYVGCTDENDIEFCNWNEQRKQLMQLLAQEKKAVLEEVEKEVRRLGDTSDYPEWKGLAGINVGLIPKEKVISYLQKSAHS